MVKVTNMDTIWECLNHLHSVNCLPILSKHHSCSPFIQPACRPAEGSVHAAEVQLPSQTYNWPFAVVNPSVNLTFTPCVNLTALSQYLNVVHQALIELTFLLSREYLLHILLRCKTCSHSSEFNKSTGLKPVQMKTVTISEKLLCDYPCLLFYSPILLHSEVKFKLVARIGCNPTCAIASTNLLIGHFSRSFHTNGTILLSSTNNSLSIRIKSKWKGRK